MALLHEAGGQKGKKVRSNLPGEFKLTFLGAFAAERCQDATVDVKNLYKIERKERKVERER